jgi:hypothetical protein
VTPVDPNTKNQLQYTGKQESRLYISYLQDAHRIGPGLFSAEYHRTFKKHILEYKGMQIQHRVNGFNHSKKGRKIRRRREGG